MSNPGGYHDDPYHQQDDDGVPDASGYDYGEEEDDAPAPSGDTYEYEEPYSYGEDDPDADPSYYGGDQSQSYYDDHAGEAEGEEEYYYEGEDDDDQYLDDEGKPLSGGVGVSQGSNLNDEEGYYNDEYPDEEYYYGDEDDEERRRRARRRRAMCCCLILLCCLLLLIILLIFFLLNMQRDNTPQTEAPTYAPFIDEADDDFYYDDDIVLTPGVITTPMAPFNRDCEDSDGNDMSEGGFRNVYDQCECEGEIYFVPQDVQDMREILIDRVGPKFYDEGLNLTLSSCDPANMAFIWLASGDNRDAGEPRQRFAAALTFFQLNGTVWDFHDEWLGELNECLWMGIQCNNRDTVNSLAVDTNNLFGEVR
jgi:hypothetical protein